jgi:hypothetical protein
LAFLTRYPTYASAQRLGEKRLHAFTTQHGYSGHRSAAELLARLRSAPAGVLDPAVSAAAGQAVRAMVAVLTAINAALKALDASVVAHLGEHPDAAIFTSLPRSGQINAAQVLAEWGDSRAAYDHPDAAAALGRSYPSHESVREIPHRAFPVGLQQTTPQSNHLLRGPQPTRKPLSREGLRRRHRPRPRPPARHPRPGPRLDPSQLPMLEHQHPLRHDEARQRRALLQPQFAA